MATNNKKSNVTLKVIPLGGLDGIGNLVEVGVAGDDLTVGGNNADQRAVQLLRGVAQRVEQAAVRCPLGAFFDIIAVHKVFSVFLK